MNEGSPTQLRVVLHWLCLLSGPAVDYFRIGADAALKVNTTHLR